MDTSQFVLLGLLITILIAVFFILLGRDKTATLSFITGIWLISFVGMLLTPPIYHFFTPILKPIIIVIFSGIALGFFLMVNKRMQ